MMKAADAIEIFGSGAIGLFRLARGASETSVVIGQETTQDLVGRFHVGCSSQRKLAGETILKGAPETFDAAFGLGTVCGDVGDAELLQSAAELRGAAATGEFFFHRPMIIVAHEDAVAISVEAEGDAVAAQQAVEQAEIAARIFGGEKFGDQNFARGIVQEAEQGKLWAAIFQPAMQAGVQQQHLAFASAGQAALAMRGSAALTARADPGRAQQTAKRLAAEREAFSTTCR